jgi:hypothetical protein
VAETKKDAIAGIKQAVNNARWVGMSTEEIKAVFLAAVLETEQR